MVELFEITVPVQALRSAEGAEVEIPIGSALLGAEPMGGFMPNYAEVRFTAIGDRNADVLHTRFVGRHMGDDVSDLDWSHWVGGVQRENMRTLHIFELE